MTEVDIGALKQAAERGDSNAQFRLAVFFLTDTHAGSHPELALDWLKKAARANHPDALNVLPQLRNWHPPKQQSFVGKEWLAPTVVLIAALAMIVLLLWYMSPADGRAPVETTGSQAAPIVQLGYAVTTKSTAKAWRQYKEKQVFTSGDPVGMYAEALDVNRNGRMDTTFRFDTVDSQGRLITSRACNYKGVTSDPSCFCTALVPSLQSGDYRIQVTMRDNIIGQSASRWIRFTVRPALAAEPAVPTISTDDQDQAVVLLRGKWVGQISGQTAELSVGTTSEGLQGVLIYETDNHSRVLENVTVTMHGDEVVLTGINYRFLSGRGLFFLDTLEGKLSEGGSRLEGILHDTRGTRTSFLFARSNQ